MTGKLHKDLSQNIISNIDFPGRSFDALRGGKMWLVETVSEVSVAVSDNYLTDVVLRLHYKVGGTEIFVKCVEEW